MLFVSRGTHALKIIFGFEFKIKNENVSRETRIKIMISDDELKSKTKEKCF